MNPIRGQIYRIAIVVLMAGMLSACTDNMDDLAKYIISVKARPASPIPPIPPVKTFLAYDYDGTTGRDPFRVSISEGSDDNRSANKGDGPRPDFDRPTEYLERYELDTLSMVGTFSKGDSSWALIRDPEGVVHRVEIGDYMGKNHGKMIALSDTKVSIRELISDGAGGWIEREASIALVEK